MAFTQIPTYTRPGIGYYSQDIIPTINSFIGKLFFGIADPSEPGSRFNKKSILLESTTVEDGYKLKWGLNRYAGNDSALSAAVSAGATTITVDDGTVFNVGDEIIIGDPFGTFERKYIVGISGNTLTVDSGLSNGYNAGDAVKRVVHAKAENKISDSTVADRTREEEYNYIQTFDVDLSITNRDLNKHILETIKPFANMKDALKNRQVNDALKQYLAKEVFNAVDNRLMGDIERAFWFGNRAQVSVDGTRYFTGGFETYKTEEIAKDASTFTSDKELFDFIWNIIYDVENEAQKIKATDITIVMNNAMFKRFMTLEPSAVQLDAQPTEAGYRLTKLFVNNRTYEIVYSPVVDEIYNSPNHGVMYVFPLDSVAGKTLEYTDITFDGKTLNPKKSAPVDLKIVIDPNSEATGDAKTLYILYQLGFVFGGYTPSIPLNIYRKAIFTNIA